jgi:DNA polymerase III delta subunit|tara:strand:+ start:832 stop:1815 length:984 start_codon:yes stop_codon:yes gene_type:complete
LKTKQFDVAYRELKSGNHDPIYFLMGEDQFLHSYFINELANTLFKEDPISKTFLIPDDMGSKEIMDQLVNQDLFNSKKIFILINPNGLKGKTRDEIIMLYKDPPPNNTLVISQYEYGAKNKFIESLVTISRPIICSTPFDNEMIKWAKIFFNENGISDISNENLTSIVSMAGDSLVHLKNEIDKISIAADDPNQIDVTKFSGWKRKYKQYEFFNFLGEKRLNKSLELGRSLVLEDTSMINLLYPLTEFFQELLFIKIFKGTNTFRKSYTRLSPSVNKKLPIYAQNYKNKEIVFALKRLEQIDKKLKTSRIKDEPAITEFIYATLRNG